MKMKLNVRIISLMRGIEIDRMPVEIMREDIGGSRSRYTGTTEMGVPITINERINPEYMYFGKSGELYIEYDAGTKKFVPKGNWTNVFRRDDEKHCPTCTCVGTGNEEKIKNQNDFLNKSEIKSEIGKKSANAKQKYEATDTISIHVIVVDLEDTWAQLTCEDTSIGYINPINCIGLKPFGIAPFQMSDEIVNFIMQGVPLYALHDTMRAYIHLGNNNPKWIY